MGTSNKQMKKALFVNPYWDTLGGGERYTATAAKILIDHRWHVDILGSSKLVDSIKDRFNIDLGSASFVGSDIYTAKYDFVFWLSDGSLPLSFAKKTLVHFQFPFRNIDGKSLKNKIKTKFYSYVSNSEFTKKHIDLEFGINSSVLYPPVNVDFFTPGKKEKVILYVGRFSQLTQLKNPHLLIDSYKILQTKYPDWKLVLAGGVGIGTDHIYFDNLKKAAHENGVTIAENPSIESLKSLYSHATFFWSAAGFGVDEEKEPTKVEHFGMSLVESMSAGCVPVVSNLGGHKEILKNSCGVLCSSPQDIAKETISLIEDQHKLNLLKNAAINRSQLYSVSHFTQNFAHLVL